MKIHEAIASKFFYPVIPLMIQYTLNVGINDLLMWWFTSMDLRQHIKIDPDGIIIIIIVVIITVITIIVIIIIL